MAGVHKWDRGLDYSRTYAEITSALGEAPVKAAVLLIALRNGARVGEAIEAYNEFCSSRERKVRARVEKRGFRYPKLHGRRVKGRGVLDKPVQRWIIIPPEIREGSRPYTRSSKNLSVWSMGKFGWNPHSLRYAFITYLSSRGEPPQTIAGITGHKTLNEILEYTQQRHSDEVLESL